VIEDIKGCRFFVSRPFFNSGAMLCGHEWMRNRNENTEVKPKNTTFIAARFGSTLSSEGTVLFRC